MEQDQEQIRMQRQAKSLVRDAVASLKTKYPTFDAIDNYKVVEIYGLRVKFLLRLSPAIPFNAVNYLIGLTSVSLRDYVMACAGMLPGTIAYCFIGGTLGSLADAGSVGFSNPIVLILLIVGTAITLIGMIILSIYAKKKYVELRDKIIAQSQSDGMDKPKIESDATAPHDVYDTNGSKTKKKQADRVTIKSMKNRIFMVVLMLVQQQLLF